MAAFLDLFINNLGRPQSDSRSPCLDHQFQTLLADGPFRRWQPGEPIAQHGERLLIGVALWSGYDLRLLDVTADALCRGDPLQLPVVEVFNTSDCKEERDFRRYIPRLRHVFHTPVVGVWRDGRLDVAKEGYEARDLVARRFGSDSAAIVEYVQDHIKARSQAPE